MSRLKIANVTASLADDPGRESASVDILVVDDRIAEISPTGSASEHDAEIVDGRGLFAAPGLINCHYHSHESFQKGRYESLPLELWMNLVRPLKPIPVTPEQVYLRTMIGAIQALRCGTTTIVDDMNVSPRLDRAHVEAAFRAYDDIGIRAYLGMTLFDRPFFRGVPFVDDHFPEDLLHELDAVQATPAGELLAFAEHLALERNPGRNRVGYVAAPSAPQRCTEGFLLKVRDMADRHDLPIIIHVQETRLQVVTGYEFYGSTMIEYLHRIGFLSPRTCIIHGVWVTPRELDLIAESGASVQHNPNSNLKLGSGLMPMREMLRRGINVALGTDGCGSIESVDMLRVLANTALLQKLRDEHHEEWVNSDEAYRAATVGGANALGRPDLGRIEVGAKADIALYDTRTIAFTPLNDPVQQLVYSETGQGLAHLIIDGRVVMRDGKLTCIDERRTIDAIHEAAAALEPAIIEAEKTVGRIRAPYEKIHQRCSRMSIPPETLPAKFARCR